MIEGYSMNRTMSVLRLAVMAGLCAGLTLAGAPTLAAEDAPAEVSQDGLHLTKQTKSRLVYLRPGTTFTQYKRVSILDCAVDFSKDWVRDYNSSQREVSRKIRDADLERAKTSLSASFKKIFT
ncbi:MAG TPA: hypothetical protein VLL30_01955, partial [Reyranella sp.]|nr:hypothetical protein [Reyranella sp.]